MKDIRHTFHIDATFDKVFNSLSTIEGLAGWWTKDTTGSCNVGDSITFTFGQFSMSKTVIQSKKNELVEWKCSGDNTDWKDTIIKFELSENDNKMKVQFSHSGFAESYTGLPHINFTWGRFMVSLRDLCEKGKGDPYIHS